MTENHDYNTPAKGSTDWHTPLNENFEKLDEDVEIRDVEANIGKYTPTSGSKFLATDTETTFVGTGSEWTPLTSSGRNARFDSVRTGLLSIEPAVGDSQIDRVEPFVDALRGGFLVGQAPDTQVVIDPLEHATDADAVQRAHDELTDRLGSPCGTGVVWIPPLRPDRTEFTITKTVTFEGDGPGGSVDVYPRGWGFFGRHSPMLQLDIDDGSPAFECRGMKGQGGVIGGFRAEGATGGEDCEFLRLHDMTAWCYKLIEVRGIGGPQQNGAIVFDGPCYNSHIDDVRYNTAWTDVTEGNFFAFRDLESTGEFPGELKFGDGISCYADPSCPFKHAFDFGDARVSDILIRGRYEGYGGHGIYGSRGAISLGDGLELGRVEDNDGGGSSRVFFTGYEINISDGVSMAGRNDTGGANVHLEVGKGSVGTFASNDPVGDVLEIPNDTGANTLVVPREQAFGGSVTYPSSFNQLVYRDGWQKVTSGSVVVPTGGSVRLGNWLGKSSDSLRVDTRLADPAEDVFFSVEYGYSSGSEQTARIVDRESTADYSVEYEVEKRAVEYLS